MLLIHLDWLDVARATVPTSSTTQPPIIQLFHHLNSQCPVTYSVRLAQYLQCPHDPYQLFASLATFCALSDLLRPRRSDLLKLLSAVRTTPSSRQEPSSCLHTLLQLQPECRRCLDRTQDHLTSPTTFTKRSHPRNASSVSNHYLGTPIQDPRAHRGVLIVSDGLQGLYLDEVQAITRHLFLKAHHHNSPSLFYRRSTLQVIALEPPTLLDPPRLTGLLHTGPAGQREYRRTQPTRSDTRSKLYEVILRGHIPPSKDNRNQGGRLGYLHPISSN